MKNETRDRLVQTARMLFWEHGYASTGIAQILKAADAGSGSLYYFFPTKEDLLIAVLESYKELLWPEVVQPVFDRVSDPIERIFGILDGYRTAARGDRLPPRLPDRQPGPRARRQPSGGAAAPGRELHRLAKAIEQCLADAAGRLPDSVDRKQLALFVLTTMEGAVMLARTYRSIAPYDAAVTQLRDYFDRLLRDGTELVDAPAGDDNPETEVKPSARRRKSGPTSVTTTSEERSPSHVRDSSASALPLFLALATYRSRRRGRAGVPSRGGRCRGRPDDGRAVAAGRRRLGQ